MKHYGLVIGALIIGCFLAVMGISVTAAYEDAIQDESFDCVQDIQGNAWEGLIDFSKLKSFPGELTAKARQAHSDAVLAANVAEYVEVYESDYYEDYSGSQFSAYYGNPDGLNSFDGRYRYNDKWETFYPTPAVYDQYCWVDDEGFYRTSDGLYVVASNDYAEGQIIEISKGQAVVMDDGTAPGVVDVHTNWRV